MTGSGKTGLGIVLLEEALLQGIPTLIIDPKGDIANLLLTFPDLRGRTSPPGSTPKTPVAATRASRPTPRRSAEVARGVVCVGNTLGTHRPAAPERPVHHLHSWLRSR